MALPRPRKRTGPKGPDGLTDWQRERIEADFRRFHKRLKPIKPMVSIRNLSPELFTLAVELDVRLCEYRDVVGYVGISHWGITRNGIPQTIIDADGKEIWNPSLQHLSACADRSQKAVIETMTKIDKRVAITGGDKTLKSRSNGLKRCPWLRQLDWLHSIWWEDERDAWGRNWGQLDFRHEARDRRD